MRQRTALAKLPEALWDFARNRFFRLLFAELLVGPILRCAVLAVRDDKVNAQRGRQHGSEFREAAMKNRFIILGLMLLIGALGFALELGVTATLLHF